MFQRLKQLYERLERHHRQDYILDRAPKIVQRFLGHRAGPVYPPKLVYRQLSILLSTFTALVASMSLFKFDHALIHFWDRAEILPSFGAAAILVFNATGAPLAQPRNFFFGTFGSALIGECICKLFMLHPEPDKYLWLGGALSVAVASCFMDFTGTTHPPGGAAALLPSIDNRVRDMGWHYLPAVLVTILIFIVLGALCDNIVLRYPLYWWKPKPPAVSSTPVNSETNMSVGKLVIYPDMVESPKGLVFTKEENLAIAVLQRRLFQLEYDYSYGKLL